ncbi:unnamed protein product [Boreogadus saida]
MPDISPQKVWPHYLHWSGGPHYLHWSGVPHYLHWSGGPHYLHWSGGPHYLHWSGGPHYLHWSGGPHYLACSGGPRHPDPPLQVYSSVLYRWSLKVSMTLRVLRSQTGATGPHVHVPFRGFSCHDPAT